MPAGGPLSFQPPPPPSAWRFFLPASGNGATELPGHPRRHHPGGSFIAAADHASSSPRAGYCLGRASVRLACVCAGSGAAAFLAATFPGFASVRRHPRPGERSSCQFGGSQPLLAALTTPSVCLDFAPTTQAGMRQSFNVASLSASTAPASFLAGGGSRLAADNRIQCKKSSRRFAAALYSRPLPAADRYRHHAAVASTITSRYVEVVRCASTARFAARPRGLHNEC